MSGKISIDGFYKLFAPVVGGTVPLKIIYCKRMQEFIAYF